MNLSVQGIILAAGKSSRFKTDQTKLVQTLCGQAMIVYGVKVLAQHNIPLTILVGYQKEAVQNCLAPYNFSSLTFIEQQEQKGTGHALLCSQDTWTAKHLLVMNGDMPLVTPEIITSLLKHHENTRATITFATAHNADPTLEGYGRVIKNESAQQIEIIEARHFQGDTATYCCVNAGIYLLRTDFVKKALTQLPPHDSGELYITDLIAQASRQGLVVETVKVPFDNIRGINTLKELWTAEHIKRSEIIGYWMEQGVRFSAAQNVHVDVDVEIGANSFVGAGSLLIKGTKIGKNCHIEAFSFISNSIIDDHTRILPHCVIEDSQIASHAVIGPFAHVRNGSHIKENALIGNFVEVTRSEVGPLSKAKHLAYIGNACIGSQVNIGAGTITCNYNGYSKQITTIKDHAFIGSNNCLVAPVTIGEHAITAAGSVITEDVPDYALAFARSRQINKEGYAQIFKERHEQQKAGVSPFTGAVKADHSSFISEE
ncbi:MAG: bifunctional UDP-N-acetylglucosamine diphosphorylase/glucosamine-1-phosphate N-acetyltransferase GlmU [Candidatus Babeliaceae bacterium]